MNGPTQTTWQTATVTRIEVASARVKTFDIELSNPRAHLPGQHYVIRLTAPDGYTASRSYSIASAPDDPARIQLAIERLEDGEVSSFLHDVVEVGDDIEVRGPIGSWFTWDGTTPAVLIGGGSGVVPLMSMIRHARASGRADLLTLIASYRSPEDALFADELADPRCELIYTRIAPDGHPRPAGRMTIGDIPPLADVDLAFVCGTNGLANHATSLLQEAGMAADSIRVERFGPTA